MSLQQQKKLYSQGMVVFATVAEALQT